MKKSTFVQFKNKTREQSELPVTRGESLPLAPKPSRFRNNLCKQRQFLSLCCLVRYPFCGGKNHTPHLPPQRPQPTLKTKSVAPSLQKIFTKKYDALAENNLKQKSRKNFLPATSLPFNENNYKPLTKKCQANLFSFARFLQK